eukprot:m.99609 g.99609  ORF g.99609 m.99609 type:complete len:272 (+) comp22184_c0_seq1:36-851(+)
MEDETQSFLETVLKGQVGALETQRTRRSAYFAAHEDHARFRSWLTRQQLDLTAALNSNTQLQAEAEKPSHQDTGLDEETERALERELDDLQQDFSTISEERYQQVLLVDRLRKLGTLSLAFSPSASDNSNKAHGQDVPLDNEQLDVDLRAELKELCLSRDRLALQLLERRQIVNQLSVDLMKLQKRCASIQRTNRKLMQQLNQQREENSNKASKQLPPALIARQHKLEGLVDRNTMLRNVFQSLIVGSGVDWAADPELQETLLSLDAPLDL